MFSQICRGKFTHGFLPAMHLFLYSNLECEDFLALRKPAQDDVLRTIHAGTLPEALTPKKT